MDLLLAQKNLMRAVAASIVFMACDIPGGGSEGGTDVVVTPPNSNSPAAPDPRAVCNPFNSGMDNIAPESGVKAELYFLNDSQPRYSSAKDYSIFGQKVDATLFFNQLFVPTRPFDRGFISQTGSVVTNNNGNTLYEYFGLYLQSTLRLSENDQAGFYQLALLADDGATLEVQEDPAGGFSVNVDNDGVHPTKMGCGSRAIYMDHYSRLPIKIYYYQGPRYHISLVTLWRKVNSQNSSDLADSSCNSSGNSLFFDSTQNPPAPQSAYNNLLTRGWKPIDNSNFLLPNQQPNPCLDNGIPVSISDLAVSSIGQTSAVVTWTTNKPASTQVESTLVATGQIQNTPAAEDTNLVVTHSVTLTGLSPNSTYSIKARSRSSATNGAISSDLEFRTRR